MENYSLKEDSNLLLREIQTILTKFSLLLQTNLCHKIGELLRNNYQVLKISLALGAMLLPIFQFRIISLTLRKRSMMAIRLLLKKRRAVIPVMKTKKMQSAMTV